MTSPTERLTARLQALGQVAVAVSGGVDSITLAVVAHRALGPRACMFHAISAAVPTDGTARVREFAAREGWKLELLDAGEFTDRRYQANPVDRCYYCKRSLYAAIARKTRARILSGTNLNDLADYRPGLRAADEHAVCHPYVDCGIDKDGVRDIARALALGEVADLPAAPCLASRVETGIGIRADMLACVYAAERLVQRALAPRIVRCRVRRDCVVIELDAAALQQLRTGQRQALGAQVATIFHAIEPARRVEFDAYRMGSAFLRVEAQERSASG